MSSDPNAALARLTEHLAAGISDQDEGYFRHLAEAMPQIVFIVNADGNVEYYNQHWYTYTGFPAGTYRPDDWVEVVHPDDLPHLRTRRDTEIAGGAPFEAEYRLRRQDGVYRWHLGRAIPVRDAAGKVIRQIGA